MRTKIAIACSSFALVSLIGCASDETPEERQETTTDSLNGAKGCNGRDGDGVCRLGNCCPEDGDDDDDKTTGFNCAGRTGEILCQYAGICCDGAAGKPPAKPTKPAGETGAGKNGCNGRDGDGVCRLGNCCD